jgi:MYXO-CTERM domain-containing protein
LIAAGACSDQSGCGTQPLPGGALPPSQTIEGGAQIRVTNQGFNKLKALVPDLINDQLGGGFCVGSGTVLGMNYCFKNQGTCTPGCNLSVSVTSTTFVATNNYTLTIHPTLAVSGTIPVRQSGNPDCNVFINGTNVTGDADVELTIDAQTGGLKAKVARIRNLDLSGLIFTDDGGFCTTATGLFDFVRDNFDDYIVAYATPKLDEMVQGFLPNPLGLEGVVDVGPLVENFSPGTEGSLEARIVPGGFVKLDSTANGLSLGIISGINSDEDPNTRGLTDSSEPALCVPPIAAPNLGLSPFSLGLTSRLTYNIPLAPGFNQDVAGKDVSIGISHDMLNQIGHHAVTSGIMCMGIGTVRVPQLNVGTIGILVPSVSALANEDGKDPMLLITRPQKAVTFTLGDNTATSPALTAHLKDFEIDVYAFLYQRYVRVFTMRASLDIGVNLSFDHPNGSPWRLVPTLVGLDSSDVKVTVLNTEFLAENPQNLETALPSVFDLLFEQLNIPPVELPTFAGFQIEDPAVSHVTGGLDDFLAISANINTTGAPFVGEDPPAPGARVRSVRTPSPEKIRAALAGSFGEMPSVTIDVDRFDAKGRELEWSWRLGKGLWRPFSATDQIVVRDPALAWQGEHTVGLISRVKGTMTNSEEQTLPVVIDSVAPHVVTSKLAWDGGEYVVPAYDLVSERAVRIAFGRPGDAKPATEWQVGTARIDVTTLRGLLVDDQMAVFLVDELGNQTIAYVAPFHGQAGASGCSCETGSAPGGGLILVAIGLVLGPRRRRRRR